MQDEALLAAYFREIKGASGLTAEVEQELSARAVTGDDEAVAKLVEGNLQFVVFVAKQYRNRGLPLSDLISAGNLGLMEGAKRFDGTRGVRFITYAVWWIRQTVLRALRQEARIVRLPGNRIEALATFNETSEKMEQELGQVPTISELAEELDTAEEEIELLLSASQAPVSLDSCLRADEPQSCVGDTIVDHSIEDVLKELEQEEATQAVRRAVSSLPKREAEVVRSYYGLEGRDATTLEGIGVSMGRTRERIRQIRGLALDKLRTPSRSKYLMELRRA